MNTSAKYFIAGKYEDWYAEQVLEQLGKGVTPHDVKVDVRLTNIKPLHAKWIIQTYHHLNSSKSLILPGFKKANITDAVNKANSLIHLCENPFQEINIVTE